MPRAWSATIRDILLGLTPFIASSLPILFRVKLGIWHPRKKERNIVWWFVTVTSQISQNITRQMVTNLVWLVQFQKTSVCVHVPWVLFESESERLSLAAWIAGPAFTVERTSLPNFQGTHHPIGMISPDCPSSRQYPERLPVMRFSKTSVTRDNL